MLWEIKPTGPNPRNRLGDKPGAARSEALMTDGLARADVWWAGTLSVITMGFLSSPQASSSPSSSLAEYCGVNSPPGCGLRFFPPSFWAGPSLNLVSSFPVHLSHSHVLHSSIEWVCMKPFLFFCFELTNRMSPCENPRHPTLPLFAQTFRFCNPYKHCIHK